MAIIYRINHKLFKNVLIDYATTIQNYAKRQN